MRQKRLTESQRVSKQNRGGKKKTAQLCSSPPTTRKLWVWFKSLLRITSRIQWKQLRNVHVSEKQVENWQVLLSRSCWMPVSATRYKDLKIDMMPSAPPADGRDDSTAALLKSWAVPENGLSTITCGQITLKVNFPPRRPSRCFLSVVSQQLILILLRIHRFLTVCRTFSGLRTVGQRQALGQICWQRSGSTPPRTW